MHDRAEVLERSLHMPQVELALGIEESIAKFKNVNKSWGLHGKDGNLVHNRG